MFRRVLPPALRLLIRLNVKAKFRRLRSAVRTPKGVIAMLAVLGMLALAVGPTLAMGFVRPRTDPAVARSMIPIGLLGFLVISLFVTKTDSGITFQPAEVDFLFPAPFRRRELLLYKIAGVAITSASMALFFSAFLLRHVTLWIAAFVGGVLALMLIQLSGIGLSLLAATLNEKIYTRGRQIALAVIAAAVVFGVSTTLSTVDRVDLATAAIRFRESPAGRVVLAPFEVFGQALTAETIPDLLVWGAAAAGIDLLLLLGVLRLDVNFLEASAATSEKRYQAILRARRGNPFAAVKPTASRWRVPQLPRWGGAGPIAWRQLCTGLRTSRRTLLFFVLIAAASMLPMLFQSRPTESLEPLLGFVVVATILWLPLMLRYDFRGDVDVLDVLKSLPVTPFAMVAGQLAAPILFSTVLQLAGVIAIAVLQRDLSVHLLIALAFLLPVNLMVFSLENLVFLLFPYRMTAVDLQTQGRQMLILFSKMMALMLLAGIAVGIGAAAYFLAGESLPAFFVVSWTVATAIAVSFLPLLCWAYQRIDPSTDTPP
jgi:Putative ABC exporter